MGEGLRCESHLHRSERVEFILIPIYVRQGAANRWVPQSWCQGCLAEYLRRSIEEAGAKR